MLQLFLKATLLIIAIRCKYELISYNLKGQHYENIPYVIVSHTKDTIRKSENLPSNGKNFVESGSD